VAAKQVYIPDINLLEEIVLDDRGILPYTRMKLSWVDSGSIWLTLQAGSTSILQLLSNMFKTSADAKLAKQVADAQIAETNASISQATRDAVVKQLQEQQDMLKAQHRKRSYDLWRAERRAELRMFDDLISQASDPDVIQRLTKIKNEALLEIAEQQMLPLVRNVPREGVLNSDVPIRLLPPHA